MKKRKMSWVILYVALMGLVLSCSSSAEETSGAAAPASGSSTAVGSVADEYKLTQEIEFTMEVTSSKITRIRRIGLDYSCATERSPIGFKFGKNLSPPLAWSGVPEGTESLALIVTGTDMLIAVMESIKAVAQA